MSTGSDRTGFTLVELLIVIALMGILMAVATGVFANLQRGWRLKQAANEMLEGAREAQSEAMRLGDYATVDISGGRQFRQQSVFLVIDVAARNYQAWQWVDSNDNGYPDDTATDAYTAIFNRTLPTGSDFSSGPAAMSGCINDATDQEAQMFASQAYPPCSGKACIKFDAQGVINGPGSIYLSNGDDSFVVSSNLPGFFRLCRWNGAAWD